MRIDRRHFIGAAAGGGAAAALSAWFPAWAQPVSAGLKAQLPTVSGEDITLRIARQTMRIDGKISRAIGINGTIPGPLIVEEYDATVLVPPGTGATVDERNNIVITLGAYR